MGLMRESGSQKRHNNGDKSFNKTSWGPSRTSMEQMGVERAWHPFSGPRSLGWGYKDGPHLHLLARSSQLEPRLLPLHPDRQV